MARCRICKKNMPEDHGFECDWCVRDEQARRAGERAIVLADALKEALCEYDDEKGMEEGDE